MNWVDRMIGECDVMPDAGARFCGKKVLLVRRKKAYHGRRLEGCRIGKVNDTVGGVQCRLKAFPRHGVDARVRCGGQRIMTGAAQEHDRFRTDKPRASDYDDLPFFPPNANLLAIRESSGVRSLFASSGCARSCGLDSHRLMKASRSGFTISACVVHMPCGNFS